MLVWFHPRARIELLEARAWYGARSSVAALAFSRWWRTPSAMAEFESSRRDRPLPLNGDFMNHDSNDDDIPEQTSAPGGVRGKYFEQYMQGTNVVLLAPDVAEAFHDSEAVNAALRKYLSEHGTPPEKSAG